MFALDSDRDRQGRGGREMNVCVGSNRDRQGRRRGRVGRELNVCVGQ